MPRSDAILAGLRAGWIVAAALVMSFVAVPASAQNCRVRITTGVAFGTYNVFSATPLDTTGAIQWRCRAGSAASVVIQLTRGSSPNWLWRRLTLGTNYVLYHLYLDAARSQVWGDGTPGTSTYTARYPGSGWVTVSVFGRIPINQDAVVGNYTDSIVAVINF
jgi:spore coat protein U-like protein